jgi:hypothetical protein
VQETLCEKNMRDKTCLHIIDVPETPDDAGMHADNTCQQAMYETCKEEAIDETCPEKGKHDVPRTTAHNIFNTKSHQNNSWQTSPRQEFAAAATLATYNEEFAAAATYNEEFAAATTLERGLPEGA